MKIIFSRSGGFAGLRRVLTLDSANLSAEELSRLEQLIEESNFFHIMDIEKFPDYPDAIQYEIIIDMRGSRKAIKFGEREIPDQLNSLVGYLNQMAHKKRFLQ